MNQEEKCELLKDTVVQLYSKEGRTKSYISKLLNVDRKTLLRKINEWNLEPAPHKSHITPNIQKRINKYKQKIISELNNDISTLNISNEIGITKDELKYLISVDDDIRDAFGNFMRRADKKAFEKRMIKMDESSRNYSIEEIDGEIWTEIVGCPNYYVSNMGRVKKYAKKNDAYFLLKPSPNKNNGRMYVGVINNDGKRKNYMLARIVASYFCDGKSEEKNTVNHIDGDVANNKASNLEWLSQSENNKHSYDNLNRKSNIAKPIDYIILYKGKYQFKTITAFSKFINKSWTQTSRYLKEPKKHDIIKIYKDTTVTTISEESRSDDDCSETC